MTRQLFSSLPLLLCALIFRFSTLEGLVPAGTPLELIEYTGASVLPVVVSGSDDEMDLLLSREAAGSDKGCWDAFSGSKGDDEEDPSWTAAREFFEEAILEKTLGWSFEKTYETVGLGQKETIQVVVKHVGTQTYFPLFVTLLSEENLDAILKNFGTARKKARSWIFKEKDGLAVVRWADLSSAILNSTSNQDVKVVAKISYLASGKVPRAEVQIPLRPFFVKTLRPYIEERAFVVGHDPRVLYYQ